MDDKLNLGQIYQIILLHVIFVKRILSNIVNEHLSKTWTWKYWHTHTYPFYQIPTQEPEFYYDNEWLFATYKKTGHLQEHYLFENILLQIGGKHRTKIAKRYTEYIYKISA